MFQYGMLLNRCINIDPIILESFYMELEWYAIDLLLMGMKALQHLLKHLHNNSSSILMDRVIV